MMGPSDTDDDDDEERLDCVHDIHGDGEDADDEDVENGGDDNMNMIGNDSGSNHHRQQMMINNDDDAERPLVHDSSMEGDIEDTVEGSDTDRRIKKRPSLFNKL